ncbi:unnamed protein product [Tilletia controversa]|nr:unnamed protein product [Tilletia controversa]
MAPITRQEQRVSMRGNGPSTTDLALHQILDEFDNYKKMMAAQNRDIIKTNIFGQGRIRHLEDQVTALEEKITIQTAGKTRAEARAQRLEHQLECIHIAFDYLAKNMTGNRPSGTNAISADDHLRRGGTSPPHLPPPPTHAPSNSVKIDPSALPAGVVRPVARPPAFALGRVQEELTATSFLSLPQQQNEQSQYMYGPVGNEGNDHSYLLYPPLPSPSCTESSSAPSPVRTPDLEYMTLPLSLQSTAPLSALGGLNIRIEPDEFGEIDLSQPPRPPSRPGLVRSDGTAWSVNSTPVQPSSGFTQDKVIISNTGTSESPNSTIRVTVRKRMQGRTGALMPAPSSTTARPSVVGPSSPWSTAKDGKGEPKNATDLAEQAVRFALADTSNTHTIRGDALYNTKMGKEQTAALAIRGKSRFKGSSDSYEHVDTPVLRPSFDLPSPEEQSSNADRFATIPSVRKRKMAPEPTRPLQIRNRSRSEDSCVCMSRVCKCTGTRQHAANCDCTPCACGADPGTPSEIGSATPRGQNVPLPFHQDCSVPTADQSAAHVPDRKAVDRNADDRQKEEEEEEEANDRGEDNHDYEEEEEEEEEFSTSGRPSRRARKEVNYALPKLNTKMRKPQSEVVAGDASGSGSGSARSSTSSRLSHASSSSSLSRRSSANSALRAVAMVAAAQGKRTPKPAEDNKTAVAGSAVAAAAAHLVPLDRQRSRSRSSSSDVSIMSFTSNSSGTPLVRSPVMPEYVEEEGEGTAASSSVVGFSMSRQNSRDTVVGGAGAGGVEDRSAGSSTTVIPTETTLRSDSPAVNGDEVLTTSSSSSSSRPTRRSAAAVKYVLPKLNTKIRKPDAAAAEVAVPKKRTSTVKVVARSVQVKDKVEPAAQEKGRRAAPGGKTAHNVGHSDYNASSGHEDDDTEEEEEDEQENDGGHAERGHESASVSANIAYYSTRTLRKSVIPSYVQPKLNTKMRKPDSVPLRSSGSNSHIAGAGAASATPTAGGSTTKATLGFGSGSRSRSGSGLATALVTESPKRKSARRSMSTGNLLDSPSRLTTSRSSSSGSSSSINNNNNNVNNKGSTKSLGRAATTSTSMGSLSTSMGSLSTSLDSSVGAAASAAAARTSLHAMLTHTARERSGSSTSSGSTVRGAGPVKRGLWADDDDDEEEEEEQVEEELRGDGEDEEGESDESSGLSAVPGEEEGEGGEESEEEEDEDDDDAGYEEEEEEAGNTAFIDTYDDRMDPFYMSDPPLEQEEQGERMTNRDNEEEEGRQSRFDADSTAGSSVFAVGSASIDPDMSGYDSTVGPY